MKTVNGFRYRGQMVRHYRKEEGMTLKRLAALLGISYARASALEKGQRHCAQAHCEDAMKLLEVPAWAWELPTRSPFTRRGYQQPKRTSTTKALRMNQMWERNKRLGATKEPTYPVYVRLPVSVAAALAEGSEEMSLSAVVLSAVEAFVGARQFAHQNTSRGA